MFPYRQIFLLVRTFLSRAMARRLASRGLDRIRNAARRLAPGDWSEPNRLPPMQGLTAPMRDWSAGMTLWHTRGANRGIMDTVIALARGNSPGPMDTRTFDAPPAEAGPEQLPLLEETVGAYLEALDRLPALHTAARRRHPIFGTMDAHGWHCLFALHLRIHRRQLERIADLRAARR